jgi:hypothetical protein
MCMMNNMHPGTSSILMLLTSACPCGSIDFMSSVSHFGPRRAGQKSQNFDAWQCCFNFCEHHYNHHHNFQEPEEEPRPEPSARPTPKARAGVGAVQRYYLVTRSREPTLIGLHFGTWAELESTLRGRCKGFSYTCRSRNTLEVSQGRLDSAHAFLMFQQSSQTPSLSPPPLLIRLCTTVISPHLPPQSLSLSPTTDELATTQAQLVILERRNSAGCI